MRELSIREHAIMACDRDAIVAVDTFRAVCAVDSLPRRGPRRGLVAIPRGPVVGGLFLGFLEACFDPDGVEGWISDFYFDNDTVAEHRGGPIRWRSNSYSCQEQQTGFQL